MIKVFHTCNNIYTHIRLSNAHISKKQTKNRPTLHNLYRLIVSVHNPSSSSSWLVGGWLVMYLFDSVFDRRQIFTLYSHHHTSETAALEKNCFHISHRNTVFILNEYTVAIGCSVYNMYLRVKARGKCFFYKANPRPYSTGSEGLKWMKSEKKKLYPQTFKCVYTLNRIILHSELVYLYRSRI